MCKTFEILVMAAVLALVTVATRAAEFAEGTATPSEVCGACHKAICREFAFGFGSDIQHHWLDERQFLDAVAVAIITPGPVVITAAFVGYLVAGLRGSLVAATGVFLPVYLFVLFVGRYIIRYREHPALKGFVKGATAAASGAIAGAAVILAQGSIVDIPTVVLGVAGVLLLWRFRIPEPLLVGLAAVAGLVLYHG